MGSDLAYYMGLTSPDSPWYLWWSGIAGSFRGVAFAAAIWAWLRFNNCAVKGCFRRWSFLTAAGDHVCHVHRPTGAVPRKRSFYDIASAHFDALPDQPVFKHRADSETDGTDSGD